MKSFAYHKPTSVADAVALLAAADSKPLSGGMTLLPTMKQRLAEPSALIDLSAIASLRGIGLTGDMLTIGAATRHADVAASALVREKLPALAALAGGIGDPAVRHRGTIGGSVANNDPAADYPAAVLGLGATIVTNTREILADDFFLGMFQTALEPGELIVALKFPLPLAAAYQKFKSEASRYALVGVFVAQFPSGARVAVTGAAPSVFRATTLETALSQDFTPSATDGIVIDAGGLNSDMHAESAYRAHLIPVLTRRAVAAAS